MSSNQFSFHPILTNTSLAHTRWSVEAKNLALCASLQLAHSDELENALLDVFHAVMVFVQNVNGTLQIEILLAHQAPWQCRQPVQVVSGDTASDETQLALNKSVINIFAMSYLNSEL